MKVSFQSEKLQKCCSSEKEMARAYGPECAKKLQLRLTQIQAAKNLRELQTLPQALCHELKADRAGELAVDLKHPKRLVFKPDHEPIPKNDDGGLDLEKVTAIEIIDVVDYH